MYVLLVAACVVAYLVLGAVTISILSYIKPLEESGREPETGFVVFLICIWPVILLLILGAVVMVMPAGSLLQRCNDAGWRRQQRREGRSDD